MQQSKAPTRRGLFLFFSLSIFIFTAAAAIPPVEKLLSDDTLIVVTTPDFAKMRETYRNSPQMQFWNDPAMKPFKDHFLSKLKEELIQPLERDLGIHFDDYTNLAQGQVTFAMTQNTWQGKDGEPALLFLLDTKDKNDQLRKNLAEVRKKWVEANKTLKTEKIRDVEFSVFPISGNDVPKTLKKFFPENEAETTEGETNKTSGDESFIIGQYQSLLIIGTSIKPVEKVMVHLTGGAMPSLGDLAAYDANRLALFRDAPVYGWVNAKAFMDILIHATSSKDDPENPSPFPSPKIDKILTATGLNGLKTVAFAGQTSSDGALFQIFVGIPESARSGLFKLFPSDAKDSSPPPFVPADTVKFQRWRIDGQKTWATLQKVMTDSFPQGMVGINFMLETAEAAAKEKDPDFDIKKNLFGNLGDDLIVYQKAGHGNTLAELNATPSLYLIGSPNPDQLAAALKSVLVLMNSQGSAPAEREFLGRKIYSIPLPPSAMAPRDPKAAPRALSYASSSGYVAITTDASLLEEYLRSSDSQQKTLRETPGLTEATAKVGGSSTGWFGYENQAETARATLDVLRRNSATNSSSSMMMAGAMGFPGAENAFKDWMDFSLLPPFEKIAKYFYFTVYSGTANVDGLTFKIFSPVPPGLRK